MTAQLRLKTYDSKFANGSRVPIDVARADPLNIRLTGTSDDPTRDLVELGALVGLILAGAILVRAAHIRAIDRLLATPTNSFAMMATLTAPRFARYPVLSLFPLDTAAGARPICSLHIAGTNRQPIGAGPFPVEVKGTPRPFGSIVARVDDGRILWPAARALATAGPVVFPKRPVSNTTEPEPGPVPEPAIAGPTGPTNSPTPERGAPFRFDSYTVGLVLAAAVALVVSAVTYRNASNSNRVRDRSIEVNATVTSLTGRAVEVNYEFDTRTYHSTAAISEGSDYTVGTVYPASVDPDDPTSIRMAKDPYDGVTPVAWSALAAALAFSRFTRRRFRERGAQRHITETSPRLLLGTLAGVTLRTVAVKLRGPDDPVDSFQGLVMIARPPMATGELRTDVATPVRVWGALDPGELPVLAIGTTILLPRRRVRPSQPLRMRLADFRQHGTSPGAFRADTP